MSFLSRETALHAKATNFYILIWAIIVFVLKFGIGPLTTLPNTTVTIFSLIASWTIIIALSWKFGTRVKEWLDGGY